ncbi:MAG: PIN domain-containing protein [Pirellulales bacterium]
MNVVDSSGWLEYFAGGRHARAFEPVLQDIESLVVPAVSIYEVFKVLLREADEAAAIQGAAAMQRGRVFARKPLTLAEEDLRVGGHRAKIRGA